MQRSIHRVFSLCACCVLVLMFSGAAVAQYYSYDILVANIPGKGVHTDTLLANPWGLAYGPGAPFWVSDEASGWSTLYNRNGVAEPLQVIIPSSSGSGWGTPTGIVYNPSSEFQIENWTSAFLFATLDGTISGWSHFEPNTALIGARQPGAMYTGLAISKRKSGNFLYAADFANNKVDVYDANFHWVKSFTDPSLPTGFAPFGIQNIGGRIYVAFASQSGGSGGYIEIFHEDGTFVKRLVKGAPLNQPWGIALAPDDFGPLSGTLLVSNNVDAGTINGFDPATGAMVGTLKNRNGGVIKINGLWGIAFGGGTLANGKKNQLFFAAGPNDTDGYFGVINSH
ncbi:MAG TPA: TIGR03118 family protein [Verrucomicrobiae bacterium]|nr:TIGR03118 family protein [Verrucomicrobiae bacterium]